MAKLLPGDSNDIIQQNQKSLCADGMSEAQAMHLALKHAKKGKAVDRAKNGVMAKKRNQVKVA
jgi:hypothetical protein